MKITVKKLKQVIRETLYDAYRTKGGKRSGDPIRVDAVDTRSAAEEAAKRFGGNIDPFTVDVQPVDDDNNSLDQDRAVFEIADVLESDSGIVLTDDERSELKRMIEADVDIPSWDEIKELIMGDDDGKIPYNLQKKFPNVDRFIREFFK